MPAYLGVATDVMHIQSEQVPEAMWHEDSTQVSLHHLINLVVQVTAVRHMPVCQFSRYQ